MSRTSSGFGSAQQYQGSFRYGTAEEPPASGSGGASCARSCASALSATNIHDLEEVRARVSLVEKRQYAVVQRLDGARHERAAAGSKSRQQVLMLKQMLDLDRDVETDARVRRVHGSDDVHGVSGAIEE